jgi:hypothetical protein
MFPGMAGGTTGRTNMFPPAFGTTGANGMGSSQFAFMEPNMWAGTTAGSTIALYDFIHQITIMANKTC